MISKELADYLEITLEQLEEMDPEIMEDTGMSGDMVYSYFFNVPENTPPEVLRAKKWKIGDLVTDIPRDLIEADDPEDYMQ